MTRGAEVVSLRAATLADAPLLRRWDEQPHVIQSDPNDEWNWELELARNPPPDWREFLIAEIAGRPIGFLQLIDAAREETHYWGDAPANIWAIDIWIGEASDLGRGYGTQMMRLALARCFAPPAVTAVWIDPLVSNVRAHRFYERFGFVLSSSAASATISAQSMPSPDHSGGRACLLAVRSSS